MRFVIIATFTTMSDALVFYPLAGVICLGALGVLLSRHPVYAVLGLVVSFFGLSALFVALGAYFVAVIQILVSAGAVLVLYLFVVMLLDLSPETLSRVQGRTFRVAGLLLAGGFLWQLFAALSNAPFLSTTPHGGGAAGTTAAVGRQLFTTYALPFEVASFLLLAGIIGAIVLAKRQPP